MIQLFDLMGLTLHSHSLVGILFTYNAFLVTTIVHKIKRRLAGGLEFKGVGAK